MGCKRPYSILLLWLLTGLFVLSQDSQLAYKFNYYAKQIRQSTYFDSVFVFSFGDSAIQIARRLNSMEKEAQIYQYYGNYYYFSRKHKLSHKYYQKSINLAKKAGNDTLVHSTLIRKAFILADSDNFKAEKDFEELLPIVQKNKEYQNTIECYNGLGIIQESRGNRNAALEFYLQGLKVAEQQKMDYQIGMLLNNIGLIKFYNKQYKDARNDLERGVKYAEKLNELRLALNLHNNLGLVSSSQNDYKTALGHYRQTLKKAHYLGFPQAIAVAHLNLANSMNEIGHPDSALIYIDSSILIFERIGDNHFVSRPYFLKAGIIQAKGNLDLAFELANKGLSYARKVSGFQEIAQGMQLKSEILKEKGLYQEALEAFERFHTITDSLSEVNNSEKIAELQLVYDMEKKDAEITLLEKENALKASRLNIIIVSSISAIILILAFFSNRQIRLRRRQQREFTQKLIASIDDERSRISRDLHDDIGQSLSVIKAKINLIEKGRREQLEGLETELGEVINQTRQLSHSLHPSYLEKIGITRSVASLMDRIQRGTGIVCSYEIDERFEHLGIYYQSQLYRIIQECVNNTLKHAEAKALKLILSYSDDQFLFEYMDNGKGMQSDRLKTGIGMDTIRERSNKIGGKVYYGDVNGKGFRLYFKFNGKVRQQDEILAAE
jgi:two-component system, NarL family, sensor kinase